MEKITVSLIFWNVLVLCIYGIDKLCAIKGMRRIREVTLLAGAFLFGGLGAIFGMVLFHHKISKMKFRVLVPLAVIINIIMLEGGHFLYAG